MLSPSEVVDGQIEAYRSRDVERYATHFSPDVVVTNTDGEVFARGVPALKEFYGPMFRGSPDLRVEVVTRHVIGAFVVDEEHIEGLVSPGMPESMTAGCVYRVENELISSMTFLIGERRGTSEQ